MTVRSNSPIRTISMISVSHSPLTRAGAIINLILAVIVSCSAIASAQDTGSLNRATFDRWLGKYADAKPDFKPGDVLSAKDLERVRGFVIPGYFDQLNFPELRMEIIAPRSHTPRKDFVECSEKYQAQVKLKADGTLANYVCGQPFANSALSDSDPKSGIRAAWNFEYRWQNYGPYDLNFMFIYARFGGSHQGQAPDAIEPPPSGWAGGTEFQSKLPTHAAQFFGGGGTFVKIVSSFYQRTYFSHLAPRAAEGGLLPVPDANQILYKDFEGFFSPYDVRGEVLITYRYNDPYRADDAWAYDPRERRVRRISVEVKSDSLAGSDQTEEDFNTFSGREVRWNFKFLGWRKMLCVMDSKYDYPRLYGPNGNVPNDVWSMRRFAVVERRPKEPNHPYSAVLMFWDSEDFHPWSAAIFDRQGRLWKTLTYNWRWSEDTVDWVEMNHGMQTSNLQLLVANDYKNQRATIFPAFGGGYPDVNISQVSKIFDVNKLEQFHR